MDIFLTGGSGFVGQRLIGRLIADGHSVTALARSAEAERRVRDAGARPARGDLAEVTAGGEASAPTWLGDLARHQAVVHAAARMEFWGADRTFEQDNLKPSLALFLAAAAAGVQRFVLVSAASVSTDRRRSPAVVSETTPTGRPNIGYSRVKLATERALSQTSTPGMSLVILRPPFIWGLA